MKFQKSGFVKKEEVESVGRLPSGNAHPLRKVLRSMEVGAVFRIYKSEWHWMNKTPQVIMNEVSAEQNKKFDFSIAADDSSWFIERLA
jgi:hypothetical protein